MTRTGISLRLLNVFLLAPACLDSFESDDDGGFHIHRKMLRRRHVRKEQKEREERRREEEEQRKKSGESRESTENLSIVWTTDDSTLSLCSAGGAEGAMNSSSCLDKPIATTTPASPYPPQTVAYPLLVPSASGEISGLPYPRTHLPAFSPLRSRKQRETNL